MVTLDFKVYPHQNLRYIRSIVCNIYTSLFLLLLFSASVLYGACVYIFIHCYTNLAHLKLMLDLAMNIFSILTVIISNYVTKIDCAYFVHWSDFHWEELPHLFWPKLHPLTSGLGCFKAFPSLYLHRMFLPVILTVFCMISTLE